MMIAHTQTHTTRCTYIVMCRRAAAKAKRDKEKELDYEHDWNTLADI